ncbi:acyltransferase [Fusobacterium hwasookii]|uniref:acyltransferase family protein n=1 Tax=Fusobacterium hwasookii TaxID=1583098 RepID=UPI0028E405B1|nr:acyltransferase [Fusobacterium hwasookii]
MEKARNNSLDFLKIIATILIVFHHYQQALNVKFTQINFFGGKFYFGYLVELFFLISGFLMFNYIEKIKQGLNFESFFINRVKRFLPLVAIAAILYECLIYFYFRIFGEKFLEQGLNFFGTIISILGIQAGWSFENPMINNPTWYISVLILCYILFYISTKISILKKINCVYLYVILIFLGLSIQKNNTNLAFLNYYTARGYYSFFFGVLFSIYFNNYKIRKFVKILSIFLVIFITYSIVAHYSIVEKNIKYTLTFIYYPALIIIFNIDIIKKIYSSKLITKLAETSFNVYVWHVGAILIFIIVNKGCNLNINFSSYKVMIVFTILLYIFGTISYYLIEKPLEKLILKKN